MKRFLVAVVVAGFTVSAFAQSVTREVLVPQESVSVTGIGRTSVTPDKVSFTVGVQTVAPTVEEAVQQNNTRVANVIAALKRAGAADKDIRTSNFSIYPQQDYTQGKLPRILGYQVSNTVAVTSNDPSQAGKLLQVAVNAGVNQSSGLQFEVSDPSKGRDQGLRAAFNDARSKATLLAQAAGRTLGRALTITEGGFQHPVPPPMPMMMRAEAGQAVSDVPVESGTQESTYTISVVFELR
jgi:uncharacterized protein